MAESNWCEFCRIDHGEITHAEFQRKLDKVYWKGATLDQAVGSLPMRRCPLCGFELFKTGDVYICARNETCRWVWKEEA